MWGRGPQQRTFPKLPYPQGGLVTPKRQQRECACLSTHTPNNCELVLFHSCAMAAYPSAVSLDNFQVNTAADQFVGVVGDLEIAGW